MTLRRAERGPVESVCGPQYHTHRRDTDKQNPFENGRGAPRVEFHIILLFHVCRGRPCNRRRGAPALRISVPTIPRPPCVDTVDRRPPMGTRQSDVPSENNAVTHRPTTSSGIGVAGGGPPNAVCRFGPSAATAVHSFAYRVPFRRLVVRRHGRPRTQ